MSRHSGSASGDGIVVVGGGPIGCATIAHLRGRGHTPALYSPTGRRLSRGVGRAAFSSRGAISGQFEVDFLNDPRQLREYPTIIVCLPANAVVEVLGPALPLLEDGQSLLVSGALSLSPLWLLNRTRERGLDVAVAGWGTTLATAHFVGHAAVHVNAMRRRIDMATLAETGTNLVVDACRRMFGDRFIEADNLLSPTLANINPIAHAAEVIPNLTRIDRREEWSLFGNFTPVVARIAEALDAERRAVARAFGFDLPSLRSHYESSYDIARGELGVMASQITARGMSPCGPKDLAHRYIAEDGPYGLAVLERLARKTGVDTPLLSASITMLETACGVTLRRDNAFLDGLTFDALDAQTLYNLCAAARKAEIARD